MKSETALSINVYCIYISDAMNKKICIANADELTVVPIADIVRCESKRNYTTVHLKDKTKLTAAKTLGDFEERLREHGFYRVHNSSLINLSFVRNFKKNTCTVQLSDDSEIVVSTRRKEEFIQLLKNL